MKESLKEFWQRFEPSEGELNIHPYDRKYDKLSWQTPLNESVLDWEAYKRSKRFGARDSNLHLSLLPVPFMGDLENADILICLANPGFATSDYYAESHAAFSKALMENLQQKPDRLYPFVYFDPQFAWTPAFSWWEDHLYPIIKRLMAQGVTRTYDDTLRLLATRIASLELFPYHSRDASKVKGIAGAKLLPSVEKMREFFAETIKKEDKLTLVVRKHKQWDHAGSYQKGLPHYFHSRATRGVSFHPDSDVGKAIMTKLTSR